MTITQSEKFNAIIIGGGHNGLVNAAYLGKAGLNVLVLERRELVGGAAVTEELLPGYKFTTFSYALSLLRPNIVQDLDLAKHGMMVLPMPSTFQPDYDGNYLLLGADKWQNYHEITRHSRNDAEAYLDFGHLLDRLCHAMKPIMDEIPPNILSDDPIEIAKRNQLRTYLDNLPADLQALLDLFWTGSVADILDEYFETDIVKSLLASSSIIGSMVSPRSAGSGLIYLFHVIGEFDGVFGEWGFHKGGNGAFTQVLAKSAEAHNVTIRTNAAVDHVIVENEKAVGVVLENGEKVFADTVVSALDPRRTFKQLVDPAILPTDLVTAIDNYKFQGSAAKVNFALSDIPPFPSLEGRPEIFHGFVNVGPSLDYLEAAFEDAKAGRFSRHPFLDCCVQSTIDPDMSPPSKHIMSCFVMYAPYHLAESDWDSERENLGDTVQATLETFFPGFGELVLHREVVTPLDIERIVGLSEGNIFQGEMFASQMFYNRPAPGWNQYRTPLAGYYQCGSGTHPGGCVIGGSGKLAARQILRDLEI